MTKLCVSREVDWEVTMPMIKGGTLVKDKNKFKLHLCVVERSKGKHSNSQEIGKQSIAIQNRQKLVQEASSSTKTSQSLL